MSTTSPHEFDSTQPPPVAVRRFTVEEYHRMGAAGVLTEDDRVELLEGWIVPKMNRSPRHDVAIELVEDALRKLIPPGFRLRIQSAVTLLESEPEPDLAIVAGPVRSHANRHPGPEEVALVVEVADSSLVQDQTVKSRIYARAGVPCYWIVNLVESTIEVSSDPDRTNPAPSYRQRTVYRAGDHAPLIISGAQLGTLAVSDLLP